MPALAHQLSFMRSYLVLAHRYIGLFIAGFLILSGLSGALISWQQELDTWLNPHWFVQNAATARAPLDLVEQLEREHPELEVTSLPLALATSRNLFVWVQASSDDTPIAFNQVALDSLSGQILGTRQWGQLLWGREYLIPLLYQFHFSLLIPGRLGMWLLGAVALLWLIDGFIALVISFPSQGRWHKSLSFRLRRGRTKSVFDLHRSGGVWLWLLLMPFAFTAIYMNLGQDLVRPLVARMSPLSPSPFERELAPPQIGAWLSRTDLLHLANAWADQHHISAPAGAMSCIRTLQLCGVGFFSLAAPRYGLGDSWVYLDAHSGEITAAQIPGAGSFGDVLLQAQLPLHSGRIAGMGGRIAISVFGVLVAGLSVTGILIWLRKRLARRAVKP